nr:NAD-dependent epimerase/dehydratase family protein [Streptomyces taklimakanensis]
MVTVLGAAGFIGSAVTALLARRPVRLRAVVRRPVAVPGPGPAELEVRPADVTDRAALADAVAGSDAVIHLLAHRAPSGSWRVPEGDRTAERVNVTVMRDLVDILGAARGDGPPPVVVFAGTVGTDGGAASDASAPANAYQRQKLAAEELLHTASARGALCGTTLRLPTVFGPPTAPGREDRGVVTAMARRALAGEPLPLWHDGSVRRDLLYVRDAARAFVAALDHAPELAGRAWTVGTGHGVPVGELFRTIAALVGARTGRPPVPVVTVDPPDSAVGADLRGVTADPSAFRAATGWRPLAQPRAALEETVAALAAADGTVALAAADGTAALAAADGTAALAAADGTAAPAAADGSYGNAYDERSQL